MLEYNYENNQDKRLSLEELRKIPTFESISDEKGKAIIDDAMALARMILDITD